MAIKLLGICGSPVKEGNTEVFLIEALKELGNGKGVEGEIITLAGKKIGNCLHCNWCVRKQTPEQFCSQKDDMSEIYRKMLEADGVLLATPVHFGRLSGLMANMIDRCRVFMHGNLLEGKLRNKVAGSLVVLFFRCGGAETALMSLNAFFAALKMIIVIPEKSQLGGIGFTSLEGEAAYDIGG